MTRKGKIARLPRAVRDELNRRLQDGEPGTQLVEWLNQLPEVKQVLAAQFGGRPINEQNVCEWKGGGHQDWLAQQEEMELARELTADGEELASSTDGRLTDHLARKLTLRYVAALANWDGEESEEFRRKMQALRGVCQDIVGLRWSEHSSARLTLEQERFKREAEKTEAEVIAQFEQWAATQEVRDWVCHNWLSPEKREKRLREILK